MNIAAYCRVSTEKADQLSSLQAQKAFFTEYAHRIGANLVQVYADEGISGTKLKNRTQFQQMMADAEHKQFDMIVVKDVSRFARNTVDLLQSVRKLKTLGIETQFLTANMTSMGDSEFVLTLLGAMAQEESANLSKRAKFGLEVSAQKGRCISRVYGYDKPSDGSCSPVINQAEASIVRQIFHWYTLEGCGLRIIAKRLNEQGVKTKCNSKWSVTTVRYMLSNEMYLGKIIRRKTERVDFLTEKSVMRDRSEWIITDRPDLQIIDPELFEQTQKAILARSEAHRSGHHSESNRYLFSSLIKCKECGYSFTRFYQKKHTASWGCPKHYSKGDSGCQNGIVIPEEELMDVIQSYFTEPLSTQDQVIERVTQFYQHQFQHTDNHALDEAQITAQMSKLERTRKKYMDLFADELISQDELNQKLLDLKREKKQLEQQRRTANHIPSTEAQLTEVLKRTFQEIRDIADVRQMTNAQLKRMIAKIEVDKDGNIDIFLRLFNGPNLLNTPSFVNIKAQGSDPAALSVGSAALSAGPGAAGSEQG